MSDTPRTDEEEIGISYNENILLDDEMKAMADFARELERESDKYRRVLEMIRDHGGKSDGESGLSMNGSWCAEQANTVLCPKGADSLDLGMPASWYAMGNENKQLCN